MQSLEVEPHIELVEEAVKIANFWSGYKIISCCINWDYKNCSWIARSLESCTMISFFKNIISQGFWGWNLEYKGGRLITLFWMNNALRIGFDH
jgi:hypothetical protein